MSKRVPVVVWLTEEEMERHAVLFENGDFHQSTGHRYAAAIRRALASPAGREMWERLVVVLTTDHERVVVNQLHEIEDEADAREEATAFNMNGTMGEATVERVLVVSVPEEGESSV